MGEANGPVQLKYARPTAERRRAKRVSRLSVVSAVVPPATWGLVSAIITLADRLVGLSRSVEQGVTALAALGGTVGVITGLVAVVRISFSSDRWGFRFAVLGIILGLLLIAIIVP